MRIKVTLADVQRHTPNVTPRGIIDLAAEFKRMKAAGHVVPVFRQPDVQLSGYDQVRHELMNGVGWLVDLQPIDNRKLVGTVDVRDSQAAEWLRRGAVTSSPKVVASGWVDGLGKRWREFIGAVALVPGNAAVSMSDRPRQPRAVKPSVDHARQAMQAERRKENEYLAGLFRRLGR